MHKQTIVLVIALLLLLVVGMLGFAYLKQDELSDAARSQTGDADDAAAQFAHVEVIEATHRFVDGTHLLSGELTLPTPCHSLTVDPAVAESYPEQVTLHFTVEENDADLCAQVLSPTRFSVQVEASAQASFKATLLGRSIPLELTDLSDETSSGS